MAVQPVALFLAGDVMVGRGVDQILPWPGDPRLREHYVDDARAYVCLAEDTNGEIPRPVDIRWPWGEALDVLDAWGPDLRVINLETSVTRSDDFAAGKAVHYRMNPRNVGCVAAVRPDVCALANNHVLDFGDDGLRETLDALGRAGLRTAGAGVDAEQASRPAELATGHGRVLVWSVASESSGTPASWAAQPDRAGVCVVRDLSTGSAAALAARVRRDKGPGDLAVVSVHWGSNWGYDVPRVLVDFAHRLVDDGVDVVHGHSSHHPRPIEVYRGRLILYGCGDLINDYEGIGGHARYRDDLRLLYLVLVDASTGELQSLQMVPMRARRIRLERASSADSAWMCRQLDRVSRGCRVLPAADGGLALSMG